VVEDESGPRLKLSQNWQRGGLGFRWRLKTEPILVGLAKPWSKRAAGSAWRTRHAGVARHTRPKTMPTMRRRWLGSFGWIRSCFTPITHHAATAGRPIRDPGSSTTREGTNASGEHCTKRCEEPSGHACRQPMLMHSAARLSRTKFSLRDSPTLLFKNILTQLSAVPYYSRVYMTSLPYCLN
jgi:hypothetical protein